MTEEKYSVVLNKAKGTKRKYFGKTQGTLVAEMILFNVAAKS